MNDFTSAYTSISRKYKVKGFSKILPYDFRQQEPPTDSYLTYLSMNSITPCAASSCKVLPENSFSLTSLK